MSDHCPKETKSVDKIPNADMGMGQNPGVLVLTSRILPENGRGDMDNKANCLMAG